MTLCAIALLWEGNLPGYPVRAMVRREDGRSSTKALPAIALIAINPGLRLQAAFRIAKRYCTIKIIGNMFLQTCLSDTPASQRTNRIQQHRLRR